MAQQPCRVSHHPGCDRQITAHCNVCVCPANQDAQCEPSLQRIVLLSRLLQLSPLFTGEVRGVAAVSNAHASWMTAMSACSESPWMITLGCPTYRANAVRPRLANGSLFPFFTRGMATICSIGASSSVFRKQQSHWMTGVPGWFCDRDTCLLSLPQARTQTLHQGLFGK